MARKLTTVLIVGGSGFVGSHLARGLKDRYKVFATYNTHLQKVPGVTYFPMDAFKQDACKRIVYIVRPDVIVYAAGNNDVEWSEANNREADRIHAGGSVTVSSVAEILQPKFIFLSNSYVFDGVRGNYHETDTVLPSTALGKSKLSGENFLRGKSLNYAMVRLSPMFGRGHANRPTWFDQLRISLSVGHEFHADHGELHSYFAVHQLPQLISTIIETGQRNKLFHFGGLTRVTQYEFAQLFAERFGFNPNLIKPKNDLPKKADYSVNSSNTFSMLKANPLLLEQSFDLLEENLVVRP